MSLEVDYIWENGQFIDWQDSKQHTICHGLHYGTSVFEGIRFYKTEDGPKVFRLREHIERFFHSMDTLGMEVDYDVDELVSVCQNIIQKNDLQDGYIRPLAYYGSGKMGLDPEGAEQNVIIAAWPWGKYLDEKPIDIKISDFIRLHPDSAVMSAKVGGYYVNSVFANKQVEKQGFDEALLLDNEGNIAEGPGENIFFVKEGGLYTPEKGTILPGITRDTIIKIAEDDLDMDIQETKISPKDIDQFDEVFFVGTAAEVSLIGSITDKDGEKYEFDVDVAKKIQNYYDDVVHGKIDKYSDWLS